MNALLQGLVLQHLRLALGNKTLVQLDLQVAPGEIVTVMGPSGAGKSTLLAMLAGLLPSAFIMSGRVLLNGRDITTLPAQQRGIGLLMQDDLLFPHLSVGGNLAFALPAHSRNRQYRRIVIEESLQEAGLEGFAGRDPASLSGGQRARVAVLRMLLAEPKALLLDEPFANLDRDLRSRFRQYVFDTARDRQLPVLLVTHDQEDACAAKGSVLSLDGRKMPM